MPTLTLKRSNRYFGMMRTLKIELNQTKIIPLRYASEHQVDLSAGHYTLVARMDWTSSEPLRIDLVEGDHKTVFADSLPYPAVLLGCFIPPFKIFTLEEIE